VVDSALKSFIGKNKPRHMQSRRDARSESYRISRENETHEESDSSIVDVRQSYIAHEDASQTSSAETVDPQTPSPLYSEPALHNAVVEDHTNVTTEPVIKGSLDPHMAHLLSVLQLSANVSSTTSALKQSSDVALSTPAQEPTPVPGDGVHSPDWSTREILKPTAPEKRLLNKDLNSAVLWPLPSSPVSSAFTTALPSSGTRDKSSIPVSPSLKRSSAADLSPYMSRAAEQPVTGKRLRQLALLETVVDESARLTPVLGSRPLASPITTQPNAYPPFSASSPLLSSPSVQHPSFLSDNLSSMYQHTSQHGPPPTQMIYQTLPNNGGPRIAPQDDAFVVRPRTSNALRPSPQPPPRAFASRASMSQAQLLGILSNGPNLPSGHHHIGAAQSRHPSQPLPMFPPRQGMISGGFQPGAMSYMSASPMIHPSGRGTPAASAGLLNILNNRGSGVAPVRAPYTGIAPN
jgi:mRNA-decapping enzyme subunit 2